MGPGLPQQLCYDQPAFGLQRDRLKTLAGVEVHRAIGLKVVVVPGIAIIVVMVVDHQTMLQQLRQRLHLALQLRGCPAGHRMAEHGHQQEKNRYALHRA